MIHFMMLKRIQVFLINYEEYLYSKDQGEYERRGKLFENEGKIMGAGFK